MDEMAFQLRALELARYQYASTDRTCTMRCSRLEVSIALLLHACWRAIGCDAHYIANDINHFLLLTEHENSMQHVAAITLWFCAAAPTCLRCHTEPNPVTQGSDVLANRLINLIWQHHRSMASTEHFFMAAPPTQSAAVAADL